MATKVYVAAVFADEFADADGDATPGRILGVFSTLEKAGDALAIQFDGLFTMRIAGDTIAFGDYAQAFPVNLDEIDDIAI